VSDPPLRVGLMQNMVDHETLIIACHVGFQVGFFIH
jgi:hypothetical protein